ncbi:putative nicotinamide N-methyase [Inhella inkyongensis]|uniref:Putative nicotinamide N-methyase n=1 Tax=Inhella inkyongensis TaxID=392593 RepID=A0A840S6U9_9BURK|nr:SAM-dependent methyltransferase [Inhella inkyongensis]MBB5205238.1 putative nicotinamide N-methyase [Inhella inkyongensis]
MPGYQLTDHCVELQGLAALQIRALLDRQQYADPLGHAEAAGISSAQWPLFGLLWPSGRQLAQAMARRAVNPAESILEIGCGLGLASLVSHRRGALVTASDVHPLAGTFLLENLRLNGLAPMRYCHGDWSDRISPAHAPRVAGRFELIMGSDVLYERDDAGCLPRFIERHATAVGEVLIVDPNRGHRAAFSRRMAALGYALEESRLDAAADGSCSARLLSYRRGVCAPGR